MNEFSQRSEMQILSQTRRARQMALAIIRRAREAGIPDQYLRINQERFAQILNSGFHGQSSGVKSLAFNVYNDPSFLMSRNFIVIDGGNFDARELAGFAILFRIIAYDKIGLCQGCDDLRHKFETINSTSEITRNDLAEQLKGYDALFLEELNKNDFSPHFDVGSFFDEILIDRIHHSKPTIITFTNPVVSKKMSQSDLASMGELDSGCGKQLSYASLAHETTNKILRIRVNVL